MVSPSLSCWGLKSRCHDMDDTSRMDGWLLSPGIDAETRSWGETGRVPLICVAGTYCTGFGNKRTTLCAPGTWNQHEGQSLCQTCPLGYTCLGYADLPTICPPGYICSIQGIDRPDRICPPCYYCPEGTNIWNDHNETTFPTRDDSIYGDVSMWPYVEYTNNPILCPAGMYCVGGTGYPDFRRFDFRHAQLCPEGYYCREGSCSATGTGPCPPGFYCPEGSIDPLPAPPGRSIGLWSVKEAGVGWKCPPGTYTAANATVECLPCPLGWECSQDGTKVPIGCGPGTFRENDYDFYCILCPDGTWSDAETASDGSVCAPCESGFVCAGEGRVTEPTTPVFYCPPGQFCHERTTSARAISIEYNCPGGFWCEEKTKPEVQAKYPCDPGKYCPLGTSFDQMNENVCPKDHFCPGGGAIGSDIGGTPDDPRKICLHHWTNPNPSRPAPACVEVRCPAGTTSALGSSKRTDCKRKCKPIEDPLTCIPLTAINPTFQSKTIEFQDGMEWNVEFSEDGVVLDVQSGGQFAEEGVLEGWSLVKVNDFVVAKTEWSVILEILMLEGRCIITFDTKETSMESISATTGAVVRFSADFSHIPETMTYLMHYQLNFYIVPL